MKDGKEQKYFKECSGCPIIAKKGKKHQQDAANANCLFALIILINITILVCY